MTYLSFFGRLLIGALCTLILASLCHSQFVLYELSALNITIDPMTRLHSSVNDMLGLLPGYGPIILVSLGLGLAIIHGIKIKSGWSSQWLYPVAGALGLFVAHQAMYPIFNITLIAGARSTLGLLCQCLAGAFGGWVFGYLSQKKIRHDQVVP